MASNTSGATKQNANVTKEGPLDTVLLALATLYEQLGQIDSALAVYSNILKRNSMCIAALTGRSLIWLMKSQEDKLFKDINKAVGGASKDPNALRARAVAYMCTGNFEGAIKDFKRSLDNNEWDSLTCLLAYMVFAKSEDPMDVPNLLNGALDGNIKQQDWPFPVLQYFRGDISMTDLMNIANSSKGRLMETRAYLGFQKVFQQNPEEGKVDLQFVYNSRSGSTLVRAIAVRGLKIIQEGHATKIASRHEKADKTSGLDWMD
ncbi:MAG: hypothetical protein K2X81_09675 [Candidatus Obscuribacterales bacterium]|nr:hypothetical protein [Candidatus Obscuribacterales bacterium]